MGFAENRRRKKEQEAKMLVRQTKRRMTKNIQMLDKSRDNFIKRAKQAKEKGLEAQYRLCVNKIKLITNQRLKAEELLLNLEIAGQIKDMAKMTNEFSHAINTISSGITKISKGTNFNNVQKQFNVAMQKFEEDSYRLVDFMEESSDTYDDVISEGSEISDDEIELMINGEINAEKKQLDSEIDDKLDELNKIIKAGN